MSPLQILAALSVACLVALVVALQFVKRDDDDDDDWDWGW